MSVKNENINLSKKLYVDMGLRLRQERLKLDYTQEQMAEILEISSAYYGKIERGIHGLSLFKLLTVHHKLNIDITYLITGEEKSEHPLEYYLNRCPKKKRYDFEQVLRYAINLATNEEDFR